MTGARDLDARRPRHGSPSYAQAGVLGLLWGLPVAATTFHLNLSAEGLAAGLASFFVFTGPPLWCATGLVLAWAEVWLSRRLPALAAASLALLFAAAAHETIVMTYPRGIAGILGHTPEAGAIFFFALWNVLCFGSLLLAGLAIARRQARSAAVVAGGEIARTRDDARLSHADLQNLRGQLSPSLLIAAVSELRRRYPTDGVGGERLLDALVAFLRAAMPSVRTGRSTLSGELETISAYADLLAELDPARGPWSVGTLATPPDPPVPPLLLLPLLEAVAGADAFSPFTVVVQRSENVITLEARGIAAIDDRIASHLERRLREGLRHWSGEPLTLSIDEASSTGALVISVPAAKAATKLGRKTGALPPLATPIPEGEVHAS